MPIAALSDVLTFSITTVVASPSNHIKISEARVKRGGGKERFPPCVVVWGDTMGSRRPNNSKMIPNENRAGDCAGHQRISCK
jgi:hypothetical protein